MTDTTERTFTLAEIRKAYKMGAVENGAPEEWAEARAIGSYPSPVPPVTITPAIRDKAADAYWAAAHSSDLFYDRLSAALSAVASDLAQQQPNGAACKHKATNKQRARIVAEIGRHFRTFGGDNEPNGNPIAAALQGHPLQFAAGVDVAAVVDFVVVALAEVG